MNPGALPLCVPVADVEVHASTGSIAVVTHHIVLELQLVQDLRTEDRSGASLPLPERRRKRVERLPDWHSFSRGPQLQDEQSAEENRERHGGSNCLIHAVSQFSRGLTARSMPWTASRQRMARTKTSQPEKKWKNPSAYSTPNHRPTRPVITMRPALATMVMGRTETTSTICIQRLGSI